MIWIIQSLICASLFIANFAWHPTHIWLAIVLNVLLALSCTGLLATSHQRQVIDSRSGYRDAAVRNAVIAVLFFLYLVASLMKLNGSSAAFWLTLSDQQPARAG